MLFIYVIFFWSFFACSCRPDICTCVNALALCAFFFSSFHFYLFQVNFFHVPLYYCYWLNWLYFVLYIIYLILSITSICRAASICICVWISLCADLCFYFIFSCCVYYTLTTTTAFSCFLSFSFHFKPFLVFIGKQQQIK